MKKKHSVQAALQSVFFLMMTAFFIICMSCYVFLESRRITASASETLDRQVSSVLAYLDGEFKTLDKERIYYEAGKVSDRVGAR